MTDYRAGEVVFCPGLDEQCNGTVERCKFVREYEDGRLVVVGSDAIKVILDRGVVFKSRIDCYTYLRTRS